MGQNLIGLTSFATGFDRPVDISNAGDSRLFITEQDGVIKIVTATGTVLPTPFLDIDPQVNSGGNERGLLGLTFHPDYANNGYFYVNYIDLGGDTQISRFSVSASDPDVADPNSELNLLSISQPFSNHNAGDLEFGPDGYLYIGTGDGGSGGDPGNRSQNRQNLLGKMLRIDVDNGTPYAIPSDNPFVGDATTRDEIWAIGLRNPWRFSFDRMTGDLFIADVGQDEWEEIDFQPANSTGGENYGWRCYEGNATFNTTNCPAAAALTFPIHEYTNSFSSGCSITGGFVYRGSNHPGMVGKYIYTDYCTGNFWWLENTGVSWTNTPLGTFTSQNYSTFGEDIDGELYVAGLSDGVIYSISDLCTVFSLDGFSFENSVCENGNSGSIDLTLSSNTSYSVIWSNGATTEDISNLIPGNYTFTATDNNGCTLSQTIMVEYDNTPVIPIITWNGAALEATISTTYQWYQDGVLLPNETNQILDPQFTGMYTVVTTDLNGCVASSAAFDLISDIEEAEWVHHFEVTPNPFTHNLHIEWSLKAESLLHFQLVDVVGRTVWESADLTGSSLDIDVSDIGSGIYFLHVSGERGTVVRKVVKE